MKTIPLTKGYIALVDDEDVERLTKFKRFASPDTRKDGSIRTVYAKSHTLGRPRKTQFMHRFLLGVKDPTIQIDHRDHDGLNNQKRNLRRATQSQNMINRRACANSKSGYKGVTWHKQNKKWQTRIMLDGRSKSLGLFTDIQDAARAYDTAAMSLYGDFACTNAMVINATQAN